MAERWACGISRPPVARAHACVRLTSINEGPNRLLFTITH